jgi:hypothetical protein
MLDVMMISGPPVRTSRGTVRALEPAALIGNCLADFIKAGDMTDTRSHRHVITSVLAERGNPAISAPGRFF